mmetsp:Transcript_34906/g.86819  ORF Transcript_34906/g.86819 Transcript_34906/m.86819 type:complete len:92 (+) Transcript_34906:69-344(+)
MSTPYKCSYDVNIHACTLLISLNLGSYLVWEFMLPWYSARPHRYGKANHLGSTMSSDVSPRTFVRKLDAVLVSVLGLPSSSSTVSELLELE